MSYRNSIKTVRGKKNNQILVFVISTCAWCKKTRNLLESLGVEYDYINVDLLSEEDQKEVYSVLEDYGVDSSFPKMIINNSMIISGYNKDKIINSLK